MNSTDLFLQKGKEVLASQPFSLTLGAELTQLSAGQCELQIPITKALLQQHGFVHGGVLSYAADNALTFDGGSALQLPVVTSEFKINYVRPALGQVLIARAMAVHVGKSQAVCRCDVFTRQDGAEKLCAVAQGTIAVLSGNAP